MHGPDWSGEPLCQLMSSRGPPRIAWISVTAVWQQELPPPCDRLQETSSIFAKWHWFASPGRIFVPWQTSLFNPRMQRVGNPQHNCLAVSAFRVSVPRESERGESRGGFCSKDLFIVAVHLSALETIDTPPGFLFAACSRACAGLRRADHGVPLVWRPPSLSHIRYSTFLITVFFLAEAR
ncbi:hypothetical protein N658DRAFT_12310 [Parathielavia hyrcaniae]|uniref:Uncharacterized protein n=1 Tax=Parathielavia hyrcaniae TaxID=113614 RepID=A0AAN6T6Y3_9PEZI|nr:hypothetical protein N658DRAFT_12310 [Parathielavia hyrcaniae]